MSAAIALEGLTKWYGRHRGIEDVTLTVNSGEIFGFIGPNGAGKSTTIRLLLGLIRPTSGTARVLGRTVSLGAKEVKSEIGYLPSEVHYYGDMRVRELLLYSAGFYKGRPLADLSALADRFEVDLDRRVDDLSLGNRKKVGILQAVLHRPRLLILDEPTSGLDPLIQNRFFQLLTELNTEGTTVFFSSHVLPEVQRLCHRVAILKEGRVIALEAVDALRARTVKKVMIEWVRAEAAWVPEAARDVRLEGPRVSFLYHGATGGLLSSLGERHSDVVDISVEQPSLEDIFMHYYGEEGE